MLDVRNPALLDRRDVRVEFAKRWIAPIAQDEPAKRRVPKGEEWCPPAARSGLCRLDRPLMPPPPGRHEHPTGQLGQSGTSLVANIINVRDGSRLSS